MTARKRAAKRPVKPVKRKATAPSSAAPQSEGQRLFVLLDASLAAIGTRIDCSKALAGYWRTGERLPSNEHRIALRDAFAIPPESWDRAPGTTAPESVPADVGDRSTLEAVDGQLVALYQLQRTGGLTAAARLKLADTLGKLLALKARLERDRELLEDRIVREHRMWKRIREALFAALKPYPEATHAAAIALQELDV